MPSISPVTPSNFWTALVWSVEGSTLAGGGGAAGSVFAAAGGGVVGTLLTAAAGGGGTTGAAVEEGGTCSFKSGGAGTESVEACFEVEAVAAEGGVDVSILGGVRFPISGGGGA